MPVDDASLRVQLEGRAELLEATRLRYRALVPMLKSLRWKDRLRRNADLLREVARVQSEVDEALATVMRRARKERWRGGAVLACAEEVATLRAALARATADRLGDDVGALGAQLAELELKVLTAPRLVMPGQRWAVALEVVPATLPEVRRVAAFGALLEPVFSRPVEPAGPLPFTAAQLEAVAMVWPEGEQALAEVWRRLEAIDLAGLLVRSLRRRARRAPLAAPRTGPEQLLHAEFWRNLALARMDAQLERRVGPVVCRAEERFVVLRWLLWREGDPEARLTASAELADGRAGLFELAHELSAVPGARGGASWDRILSRARRADAAATDPDWQRLRDSLRLLVRVLTGHDRQVLPPLLRSLPSTDSRPSPPVDPSVSLAGLVVQLRDWLAR